MKVRCPENRTTAGSLTFGSSSTNLGPLVYPSDGMIEETVYNGECPVLFYLAKVTSHRYTFWVAILVLVLTLLFRILQSIEGAFQIYKAYHPTPAR